MLKAKGGALKQKRRLARAEVEGSNFIYLSLLIFF